MPLSRKILLPLILMALGAFCAQTKPAATLPAYTDPTYHFSINAPDFPVATTTVSPVYFVGPADNAFSPNVNVVVIPGKTTRKDFLAQTIAQFATIKAKLNSQKELEVSGHDAAILDYQATIQQRDLRFLAMFVVDGDRVLQITCTCLSADFPAQEARFKDCLNSFKLTPK